MKSLVAEKTSLYNSTAPSLVPNLPSLPLHDDGFPSSFINLDQGDPVVFEPYWRKMSEECVVEIKGCELLSYMSDLRSVCWFMMPELRDAVKRLHALVGNAETNDRHIVVGNGSTQLFQAALFALSSSSSCFSDDPMNVVAAAPYYSEYPDQTDILRSGIYKWSGDAMKYDKNEEYIEVVTSPNNPDGSIRGPVLNNKKFGGGRLIHDLAYYWPQYTPITHEANYDLMLFTFSKCTGHAGSRVGWAIVKDEEIAKKMTKFIQMSSIGVSKESQTRVAKIIEVLCDSYNNFKLGGSKESELFFECGRRLMKERWEKLRGVIKQNSDFSLPKFPRAYCNFTHESSETYPAFAWLKCMEEDDEDCESYMEKKLKILVRGGTRFGSEPRYARLSMLGRGDDFDEFLKRLSKKQPRD